jgi:hypothetical protein
MSITELVCSDTVTRKKEILIFFVHISYRYPVLVNKTVQKKKLCIPEKELAKTRSQISFIYF